MRFPIFATLVATLVSTAPAQVSTSQPAWLPDECRYDKPFFPGASYDPSIPTPEAILGFRLGDRPVRHADIERCLKAWDAASPRMTVTAFGQTHERRAQYYVVISSGKNHGQLDAIRAAIGKLADPRKLRDDAEAQAIIKNTPAIAWLAYCIHGDEMSGSDAALAVIYHLIAGQDGPVSALLDETVIVVDPLQNPDGRDRFITMLDQSDGYTPVLDRDSVQHEGVWPRGRQNHYLFDLNRDWVYGVQPETRNRQREVAAWTPQLFVDSHEMGPDSTFLFNPAREPFNPNLSPLIRKWWKTFADDAGAAFDRHGWSYYTREWADFWYPGYSDGWATMHAAIGILYEQARTGGRPILLPTGRILTYREAVHHQLTVTMANLDSLHRHRTEILHDFHDQRRAGLRADDALPQTFILPPSPNASRRDAFIAYLQNQGIEVRTAAKPFEATDLVNTLRQKVEKREFPAGTVLVQRRQPLAALVGAVLDFDPRMEQTFLESERRELETKRQTRLYDITGWSPPLAWALDAYWSLAPVAVESTPAPPPSPPTSSMSNSATKPYAYVIDIADDSWRRAAAHLLSAGAQVRVASEPFRADGRLFEAGSLLIRRHDNTPQIEDRIAAAGRDSGATIYATSTARSPDDTPDLGGELFPLLTAPRVALLRGSAVETYLFGEVWHLLDAVAGVPASLYELAELGGFDWRRHNVVVIPGLDGGGRRALEARMDELRAWIRSGGTLIAISSAADFFADKDREVSEVRSRTQVIKDEKLDEYASAVALERMSGGERVDPAQLWEDPLEAIPPGAEAEKPETKLKPAALDEWRSLFSPTGTIIRAQVSRHHWIGFGCPAELPVFVSGSRVLMSKQPVQTPVRLAPPKQLRLSGLLWPEAAARLGDSAYVTVERIGAGQLILIAHEPNFRGAYRGECQLLLNAVLLGPGCGTSQAAR